MQWCRLCVRGLTYCILYLRPSSRRAAANIISSFCGPATSATVSQIYGRWPSVDCVRCTCIFVLYHYPINAAGIGAAACCVIARIISADEAAIRVRVDLLCGTCKQPQLSAKTAVLAPELCLSGRHQAVNETRARACTRTRTRTRARCAAGVGHLRAQAGVGGGHPRRRRRRPPPPLLTAAAGPRLAVRLGPNQN